MFTSRLVEAPGTRGVVQLSYDPGAVPKGGRASTEAGVFNRANCLKDNLFALLASSNTLHGTRIIIMMSAACTPLALACSHTERGCSVAEIDSFPAG